MGCKSLHCRKRLPNIEESRNGRSFVLHCFVKNWSIIHQFLLFQYHNFDKLGFFTCLYYFSKIHHKILLLMFSCSSTDIPRKISSTFHLQGTFHASWHLLILLIIFIYSWFYNNQVPFSRKAHLGKLFLIFPFKLKWLFWHN